ncbi:pimeloyl-ACP methyl ester carboxylesterase [Actinomadura coerulea]|uniref:Pimeloyl-ACP methyl ester carboxylesterase n=1 Tax=Actinomadura coerulea TaxID=46159 RepID=A0A7X0FXR8_9ACTN|nr:alpha/beta fold hydrolase [Actinomadura coerulea]MBB6395705.1 pimeloyl-ACP methyl ester carboxylesterase [Actinomadura coerulea]GGQ26540.1 hydrolase [Actinomadura coerulea]
MRVNHCYVSVGDRRTHVLHGDGPIDTLFLHGAGGSAWTFEATIDALPRTLGWASADLLGYGDSSWIENRDYSSAAQAEQLAAVIDRLDLRRVRVVGFSWGGLIALELAKRDRRVDRLAVIDIPPSSSRSALELPPLRGTFRTVAEGVRAVRAIAPGATPEVAEREACLSTAPSPEGFQKKIDPALLVRWQFQDEDHWETWRRNERETLLIRGRHSSVLSEEDAGRMIGLGRRVSLAEIAGCGHLVPLERPRELASVLSRFLA